MNNIKINGMVDTIIFHNEENGYIVFSLIDSTDGDEIVCVAFSNDMRSGLTVEVTGEFIKHPSYGQQLKVNSIELVMPSTEKEIENYLSAGIIKGIGSSTAKKMVKMFGEDTFLVIENEFEKLADIKGISFKKALDIHNQFMEQNEQRAVMMFLQKYNITSSYASKIYKKYGKRTEKIVRENPYILINDIIGISFKFADEIAMNMGISKESPFRVEAGVKFVISVSVANGNVYIAYEELINKSIDLLSVNTQLVENALVELQVRGETNTMMIEEQKVVYLSSYLYAENYISKKLIELSNAISDTNDYSKLIQKIQKDNNIKLASKQIEAVKQSLARGVVVITGGPGTGKTTTINSIINAFNSEDVEITLTAPTGRASKRMSEATGLDAVTIHRLLGVTFNDEGKKGATFDKGEDEPIESDVIIVDECSMIDTLLMFNLLKAINYGTRLILVGDVDQLPSVGAGNVLKDIIQSGVIPVVRLDEIFRQAMESDIIINAHKINQGEYPIINNSKDFFMVQRPDVETIPDTVANLVKNRLSQYLNCDGKKEIQVLTPMRKSDIGVNNLNIVLQQAFNPPSKTKDEKSFKNGVLRVGDKVMQVKNNYNIEYDIKENNVLIEEGKGIYNGDEGYVVRINNYDEIVTIVFDGNKYANYTYDMLEEIELAYAITVHKSQGSEYRAIVIPVHSGPDMLLSRNLLYTAVTRGKSLVAIVGTKQALQRMVDNNRINKRNSSLDYYLKHFKETFK